VLFRSFLKLLDKAVDFSFVNELCRDAYTPDFGRPAYGPEMMFKIIFLQFLYDVSDRRIEEEVNFNLVLKWFIGLAIDESPPDAFSLTRFRDRLGEEIFTNMNLLRFFRGGKEQVRAVVSQNAIDFLGHCPVVAPQPRLNIPHLHSQLHRRQSPAKH
jgi:transposase